MIKFSRAWAMPDKDTFRIKPIKSLLDCYVGNGKDWIDPFAGNNSPAEITNDIDLLTKATYHCHAATFLSDFKCPGEFKGAIFDPPYSLRQVKECYDRLGLDMSFEDSKGFPTNIKDKLSYLIRPGGLAICCGWDSNGFGKQRGFELIEILLVAHGGRHNDTIITVESKINGTLVPRVDSNASASST